MKIVIFSDVHGADLSPLEREVLGTLIIGDQIICLGDFDEPETVRKIIGLEKKYNAAEIEMYILPGNHELAIYHQSPVISFSSSQDAALILREFKEHVEALQAKPEARDYVRMLLNNPWANFFLDENKFTNRYNTVAIHGALAGQLGSWQSEHEEIAPDSIDARLWYRLNTPEDHDKNFSEMKRIGLNLMLRGHDKEQEFAYMRPNGKPEIKKGAGDHVIFQGQMQTVTVGSYKMGCYALIDTRVFGHDCPIVSLKKLSSCKP